MNDVFVTCIKNSRVDQFGRPLVNGASYALSWNLARDLWLSGYVSVTDASIFDASSVDVRRPNLSAEIAAIGSPVHKWQSRMPAVIFAGDGGSNGLLFTGTAGNFTLSATILSGIFLPVGYGYLPANAGGLGNAAGWFYFTMTTETAGTFYNNEYVPSLTVDPVAPTTPVPFDNPAGGRITQTTVELTFARRLISPADIGPNGLLQFQAKMVGESSANSKYLYLRVADVLIHSRNQTTTCVSDYCMAMRCTGTYLNQCSTRNRSSIGEQLASLSGDYTQVDMSVPVEVTVSVKVGANTASCAYYIDYLSITYGA